MTKVLVKQDVASLANHAAVPCLSLYAASRELASADRGESRLQTLLRRAETNLAEHGADATESRAMVRRTLEACRLHATDRTNGEGLAVFCDRDMLRVFSLPIGFVSRVVAADRFYLSPLLPWLYLGGHFHILALHHDRARLFHATRYSIGEIEFEAPPGPSSPHARRASEMANAPRSIAARLKATHRSAEDTEQRKIMSWFSDVDRRLANVLGDDESPLVLSCVGYLAVLFETVSSSRTLLERRVPGSPDLWSMDELRSQAWQIVADYDAQRRESAVNAFLNAQQAGDVVNELPTLLQAARQEQIEILYVDRDLPQRAVGDDAATDQRSRSATTHSTSQMLELLVTRTLAAGGDVLTIPSQLVPMGPAGVAARVHRC
ncbi:MAG: hypothetical protein RIC55_13245 [Pirellulaceae bacterium]